MRSQPLRPSISGPICRRLRFVDRNKPFWRKRMDWAFVRAKGGCDKWHDYEMTIAPYENGQRACPVPWHRHSEFSRGGDHLHAAPGGGREQGQGVSRRAPCSIRHWRSEKGCPPLTITLATACAVCVCQTAYPKRQGHHLRSSCLALYGDAWSIEKNMRRHPGQADRESLH